MPTRASTAIAVWGALLSALAVGGVGAQAAFAAGWKWPVRGEVVTGYANVGKPYAAGQHRGIDVAAPAGTPVTAAGGGTVRFAGVVGSAGLTVSVRTADGQFDTSYLHLADVSVRSGQAVAAGQTLGAVGVSGRRSVVAPHLHFGVREAGTRRYRDPLDFLPARPGVRDAPRGAPVPVRGPVRVGPAPRPVRPHRFPVAARSVDPVPSPSRTPWAIACAALIGAAVMLGWRSSIDLRAVLRHHADLLRQR